MRHLPTCLCAVLLTASVASAQRPVEVAPNAPADKPLAPRAWCQWDAAVRAMEPYIARARSTYPAARERFLRGLPPHHTFFVTTRLKDSAGRVEQAFVAVDTIQGGRITGRIWSDIERAFGFRRGQRYELSEAELIDWMIARPDGTEEGNVVGKFLDGYQPPDCTDACAALGGCGRSGSNAAGVSRQSPPRASEMLRVPSKDGTLLAVECAGAGPTLILVHGGIGDRTRWTPMFPLLSSHFTVCAMDRRGHGLSGDSPAYSLQKEAEDVAAVVESRRGTVFVLGHSYGGVAALEAMFLTNRVSKLILYEPPVQEPVEHDLAVAGKMQRMIEEGAREQAAISFLTEVVQASPTEVDAMKARPAWPRLVSTIDGQLRQMYALAAYRFDRARMVNVHQPTLLLLGANTTSPYARQAIDSLQASLPNTTRVVLEGQQHNAMDTGRDALARAIITFLLGAPGQGVTK